MMASLEVGFEEACDVHGLGPGVLLANVLGTGQAPRGVGAGDRWWRAWTLPQPTEGPASTLEPLF